jgi:hypothetical protein
MKTDKVIIGQRKPNQNAKCSLKRKLDDIGLNIVLKNVYRLNAHTVDELEENTRREVYSISQQELQHKIVNFLWRCQECVQNNGEHFQHLL